jgi:hypothetical protein
MNDDKKGYHVTLVFFYRKIALKTHAQHNLQVGGIVCKFVNI